MTYSRDGNVVLRRGEVVSQLTDLQDAVRHKIRLVRDPTNPSERHLLSDVEGVPVDFLINEDFRRRLIDFYRDVPDKRAVNSVALFFNLSGSPLPAGYASTVEKHVLDWLDEGSSPATVPLSDFIWNYWNTVSYERWALGVDVPRNEDGTPLIPTVAVPPSGADDWGALINACISANPEAVWKAGGSRERDGKRWIASVVLVQHYDTHASATFDGWSVTVGDVEYVIADVTHIGYNLDWVSASGVPANAYRTFWGTLCHEFGHNFLAFGDLYGPQGCTGYWDLLGDNATPGRMSEISSFFKEKIGWLTFKSVVAGPRVASTDFALRPYTLTGDSIKVVPDPEHNPSEYFLLEYRKSTGQEAWRPDGALPEEGLLIIHINERLGVAGSWLPREAGFFDPEFADYSDLGMSLWTGNDRLTGALFPQGENRSFTPFSLPDSNFYGGRRSGLSITDIRVQGGEVRFRLQIACQPRVGWTVGVSDRGLAGRFSKAAAETGAEVFLRNENAAALFVRRQSNWFVQSRQDDWIDGWNLGAQDRVIAGDLDGDGRDEVFIRSPEWAGVLKYQGNVFHLMTAANDRIGDWNLGPNDRELAADIDGDGRTEVVIRSPEWLGVIAFDGASLATHSVQNDRIGEWNLGPEDKEHVGRFTRTDRDEVLVRSHEWIGVLGCDRSGAGFTVRSIQGDRVETWNYGPEDRMEVGDFDGDGFDEVYMRSPHWAGVLKWRGGGFHVLWIREANVEHINGQVDSRLTLDAGDRSYAGRFLPDRDGILHRTNAGLRVLTWEGQEMRVRVGLDSPLEGRWQLGQNDRYVLGDFERSGMDISDPTHDFVADGLTDVFIHNDWGSAGVGVNHFEAGGEVSVEQMGLTWINQRELLVLDRSLIHRLDVPRTPRVRRP
jgi:hypothetical protein